MLNLKNAKLNKFYSIKNISEYAQDKIARRLFDLGFTSGQKIRLVRKSMIGKTLLVELRGYLLSLRADIAEFVLLEDRA